MELRKEYASIYEESLAAQINAEFERIGCLDEGTGGLLAIDWDGELAVADTDPYRVNAEKLLNILNQYADNELVDKSYGEPEWDRLWHKGVGDVLSAIDQTQNFQ